MQNFFCFKPMLHIFVYPFIMKKRSISIPLPAHPCIPLACFTNFLPSNSYFMLRLPIKILMVYGSTQMHVFCTEEN